MAFRLSFFKFFIILNITLSLLEAMHYGPPDWRLEWNTYIADVQVYSCLPLPLSPFTEHKM